LYSQDEAYMVEIPRLKCYLLIFHLYDTKEDKEKYT